MANNLPYFQLVSCITIAQDKGAKLIKLFLLKKLKVCLWYKLFIFILLQLFYMLLLQGIALHTSKYTKDRLIMLLAYCFLLCKVFQGFMCRKGQSIFSNDKPEKGYSPVKKFLLQWKMFSGCKQTQIFFPVLNLSLLARQ